MDSWHFAADVAIGCRERAVFSPHSGTIQSLEDMIYLGRGWWGRLGTWVQEFGEGKYHKNLESAVRHIDTGIWGMHQGSDFCPINHK